MSHLFNWLAYFLFLNIVSGIFHPPAGPFDIFTIQAPNITAKFIPYGARLTSLLVPDRNGHMQDVVMSYDAPEQYVMDTNTIHTYFGAVVGRYANRISNGTFSIDGSKYHVSRNNPQQRYTLHGGTVGYDQRNWTIEAHTRSSVTFSFCDAAYEGFPGDVTTYATYTVSTSPDGLPQLTTRLVSMSFTKKTPIMLTNHIYWNLDAFLTPTIEDLWLQLPMSHRMIGTDRDGVPTGELFDVTTSFHGAADFRSGKFIGQDINKTAGLCGDGCLGYDNCMIIDRDPSSMPDALVPVLHLSSRVTGISMEVKTNQPAIQIYSCNGVGPFPVKPSQRELNNERGLHGVDVVGNHGCIAIEPQGWIDGINHPDWGQGPYQIFGPEDGPAVNLAVYTFGVT